MLTKNSPVQFNRIKDIKDNSTNILFFGRDNCNATLTAHSHLKKLGFEVTYVNSTGRGQPFPEEISEWVGEYIFCFRSLFILPKYLIDRASIAAINFHPAPPEYPGSGCLNFALYDESEFYGVTAHLMNEKIDNGKIIECRRFPIIQNDTVDSLLERTHIKLLDLFLDITTNISLLGETYLYKTIAQNKIEEWHGEAKKMSDLETLKTIPTNINKLELEKIIRATYTKLYPPKITLHGYNFYLNLSENDNL